MIKHVFAYAGQSTGETGAQTGFSFIELLASIAILGMLATVAI